MTEEDFDLVEVYMNDEEIDETIAMLMELKEHRTSVQFPVAYDLDLLVNYHYGDDLEEDDVFEDDDESEEEDEEEFEEEDDLGDGR